MKSRVLRAASVMVGAVLALFAQERCLAAAPAAAPVQSPTRIRPRVRRLC